MDTMQPIPVIDHRPWWRTSPGAAAVALASVGAIAISALVVGLASRVDAGDAYVEQVKIAAPSGLSGNDADILAAGTKACEAGPAGTLGLQAALARQGFAPVAILDEIMPAHARLCDSLD